jgi:hypothetical protein
MSNMKDYMMWLDDRGTATWDNTLGELIVPDSVDIHNAELVNEYQNDSKWHGDPDPDDDELDDIEEELIIDDGDYDANEVAWTPDDVWFDHDGGLTGEAYEFLATTDSQGDFI